MNFDIIESLSRYINHIGESARLLPIVALVYLLFESPSLSQYWLKPKGHPRQELDPQQYSRLLHVGYRRRTISGILLGLLSGALFTVLLLCQLLIDEVRICLELTFLRFPFYHSLLILSIKLYKTVDSISYFPYNSTKYELRIAWEFWQI